MCKFLSLILRSALIISLVSSKMKTKPMISTFLRERVFKVIASSIESTQIEQGLNPSTKEINRVLNNRD